MKFLYWNLNKQPIHQLIANIAHEHDIDTLILSECTIPIVNLQKSLNKHPPNIYTPTRSYVPDPLILTRFPSETFKTISNPSGVCVTKFIPPIGPDITIIAVHLPSKRFQKENEQIFQCTRLAKTIEETEKEIGHRRTLIVGDFNMNPFEHGVVGADGLHAVMSKNIANKTSRIVNREERFFFYNPMWRHFGDYSDKPQGTYYYNSAKQINYYWNMFDQVMIRPELIGYFNDDDLRILSLAGRTNLLGKSGIPNKKTCSDHLPIVFSLQL